MIHVQAHGFQAGKIEKVGQNVTHTYPGGNKARDRFLEHFGVLVSFFCGGGLEGPTSSQRYYQVHMETKALQLSQVLDDISTPLKHLNCITKVPCQMSLVQRWYKTEAALGLGIGGGHWKKSIHGNPLSLIIKVFYVRI